MAPRMGGSQEGELLFSSYSFGKSGGLEALHLASDSAACAAV